MNFSEYIESLKGKRIAVIGIGVSNLPLIRALLEHHCDVTACDKSDAAALGKTAEELRDAGAVLKLGDNYLRDLEADVIFRTPGIRPDLPEFEAAKAKGAVITSEMEAFFSVCPCRIIAVTGSDGKTTTTSIIAELLRAAGYTVHVGGNIGRPLLCDADSIHPEDIAVLELSSFQLMTMRMSPNVAVVTNLAPNHLDVHKNMEEYSGAKQNIFLHQSKNDVLVLNADNEITASFRPLAKGSVRLFSRKTRLENGYFAENKQIYAARDGACRPVLSTEEILLPGDHNVENYLSAFAAADGLVSHDIMRQVASSFGGVEHRIELVRTLHGVKYYNDSIASSPSRTIAGLRAFDQKVILIAGGKDKGVPFDTLGEEILRHVKVLVLTGLTAGKIRSAVENASGYRPGMPEIIETEEFGDAVTAAAGRADRGDVVILSPACTSFDRFKNFAERGRVFKDIVNHLE